MPLVKFPYTTAGKRAANKARKTAMKLSKRKTSSKKRTTRRKKRRY